MQVRARAAVGALVGVGGHHGHMPTPIIATPAGAWPPMMTALAQRLDMLGYSMACSPDPSVNPSQVLVLVEFADGTVGELVCDPSGTSPCSTGLVNYDHHGEEHRTKMLDAMVDDIRRLGGANVASLLGDYQQYWLAHHRPSAALTCWWDARMSEGHTVEHATFLLSLIAHPNVLCRVGFYEHDGHTRTYLDHRPIIEALPHGRI